MQNNSQHSGLTALNIINPNAGITRWLNRLAENGVIGHETLAEASVHFGLRRDLAAWQLFFKRIFILMGVVLGVCGLIFFMAWNWEDMHRLAKFATLELVFILFGAYSVLRWQAPSGENRWDARIALLGAALMVGGMLALYGQVYQTGADPWELFRAWTIMLFILAVPGRATVFWFMVWLVGSLWLGLYLGVRLNLMHWEGDARIFALYMALAEFAMLAVNEAAGRILNRCGISYDGGRWLSRIIGCTAIIMMGGFAVNYLALPDYGREVAPGFGGVYLLSLGAVFTVYYRLIPELLFLSLSIFSLATVIGIKIAEAMLRSASFDLGVILMLGLIIMALAFGALKLILILNKGIRERAKKDAAASLQAGTQSAAHSLGVFKSSEAKKNELRDWLLGRGAASAEDIEACYAADEKGQELESPWYAKVFVSIGVWIGSAVSLGAFTGLVFAGLDSPQFLGLIGLILCACSIHIGHGKKLAMRSFAQVLGICGLIYAAFLFDLEDPTLLLLCLLFCLFWLLKPPFTARLAAFLGALVCMFWHLGDLSGGYYYSGQGTNIIWHLKMALYIIGLLWSVHYLVVMEARPPASWKKPGGEWLGARFELGEVLGASAYACLIFFAGLAILLFDEIRELRMFGVDLKLGTSLLFIALTGLMAWRYPAARKAALVLGPLLAVLGWFAPYLALGFGLVLLAFHSGRNAFLGAAVAYLGCSTWMYYYMLDITLLYKSLVLMGSGLAFLALGLAVSRLGRKEAAQ